ATAGLAYPFMAASLWRYRYVHSWYGDLRFGFLGSWKQLALPFYLTYGAVLVVGGAGLGISVALGVSTDSLAEPRAYLPLVIAAWLVGALPLRCRARDLSALFSGVRLGGAGVPVTVSGRALIWQYVLCGLALVGAFAVLAMGALVVLGVLA